MPKKADEANYTESFELTLQLAMIGLDRIKACREAVTPNPNDRPVITIPQYLAAINTTGHTLKRGAELYEGKREE